MPGGYSIEPNRSIVLSRAWGVLEDRELLAHARALAADPRFKPHFRQISDFRDVTDFHLTDQVIREMVYLSPFGAGARRALVVGTDVAFGLARMFQILREQSPDEIAIFRDMDKALEWLGVSEEREILLSALSKAPPVTVPE